MTGNDRLRLMLWVGSAKLAAAAYDIGAWELKVASAPPPGAMGILIVA